MRLTIGEVEGAVLGVLAAGAPGEYRSVPSLRQAVPFRSIAGALESMRNKGWIEKGSTTTEKGEQTLYRLTELGRKAMDAYRIYSGEQ